MMKKIGILLLAVFTLGNLQVRADEGMWLPLLIKRLNHVDMQKHGLQLTAEEIYSVNNASLKDAIVALDGRFCTGEIISSQGLMLTNHHCGYGSIQSLSTPEDNILTNGFWAKTKADERKANFTVWFLERMDDVTDRVLEGVTDNMKQNERDALVQKNIAKIKKEEGDEFEVQIKGFYYDNEYYMFKYNIFKDVRLVGTPPESVGKFGGDTDNWMWPRHTGDFSMFRVYANKDNKPAEYSVDNVPYKPKHHLPVSMAGVQENDYAMIMGYPGSTDRYLTSYGVEEAVNVEQPARVKIRRMKLDMMDIGMDADPDVRLQYASKHAGVANYWKYFLGQSHQLVKNNVYDKKKTIENDFTKWANGNRERQAKYGGALGLIEDFYKSNAKFVIPQTYFGEAVFQGPEVFGFVMGNFGFRSDMKGALESGDQAAIDSAKAHILEGLDDYYKDFNKGIDEDLLSSMLEMFYNDVDKEFHPETLTLIHKKFKGDFKKFAAKYYAKSPFASKERMELFMTKFSKKAIEKDLVYNLMNEFIEIYIQKIIIPSQTANTIYTEGMRLFVDGLRKMNPGKV